MFDDTNRQWLHVKINNWVILTWPSFLRLVLDWLSFGKQTVLFMYIVLGCQCSISPQATRGNVQWNPNAAPVIWSSHACFLALLLILCDNTSLQLSVSCFVLIRSKKGEEAWWKIVLPFEETESNNWGWRNSSFYRTRCTKKDHILLWTNWKFNEQQSLYCSTRSTFNQLTRCRTRE